jgi:hypothetical protein
MEPEVSVRGVFRARFQLGTFDGDCVRVVSARLAHRKPIAPGRIVQIHLGRAFGLRYRPSLNNKPEDTRRSFWRLAAPLAKVVSRYSA